MSEIKRYESGVYYCSGDAMVQSTEGDYVSYEDYAALKAECESNLKSAQYSAETNRKISRKNGEMHDEILSLKAECESWSNQCAALIKERDALAAENARMRIAINRTIGWQQSVDTENTESVRPLHELDTPATDAYANQLRAEGVAPVKLPESQRLDGNGYGYYFDMNDVFTALEDAGIKFEVQK